MCNVSHFQLHIPIIFGILVYRCSRNPLHPLSLFPNPSMARTRGGHSFRPRVRPSSASRQSTPAVAAAAASHAPVPAAPTPRRYDTQVEPTPPSPAHP